MNNLQEVVRYVRSALDNHCVFVHMTAPQLETLLAGLEEQKREIERLNAENTALDQERDECCVEISRLEAEQDEFLKSAADAFYGLKGDIEVLKGENDAMKEALEWYADDANYHDAESAKYSAAVLDEGATAQAVLSTLAKEESV